MPGAIADQLAEDGRFFDEPLIIGFQTVLVAGTDQRDFENVGQRNGEIEIALAEAALIQIGVDCAEGGTLEGERNAERVGVVAEAVGLRAAALLGDPDGMALAADEFGEGVAELGGFVRAGGDDEFGFQAAFVVDPEEADDGGFGLGLQEF